MIGEGLARRLATDEAPHLGGLGRRPLGRQLVLGSARLKLVKGKLKLIEKTLLALGPRAIERPAQLLDHQGKRRDLRFRIRRLGLGSRRPCFRRRKCCLKSLNIVQARSGHGAGSESDSLPRGNR